MTALLECRDLSVAVGERLLVEGLTLAIEPGDVWAVVGPNGAGKTTLMRTLAGLRVPALGEVRLAGAPLAQLHPRAAALRRAYLPQATHDAFGASVLDVVLLGLHATLERWAWAGPREIARARDCLAAVDAAHLADRDVLTLSGGERQRVAIATLLVQEAPLLLADEPVAHLDVTHRLAVLEHLATLAREGGRGVAFSVHELDLAARFATHALLFLPGGRVRAGPVEGVLDAEAVSLAFGHPIVRERVAGRTVFVAT